ncbi:MAG: AraC family transcriptional regulator [Stappiaceae bacterium]
MPADPLTDIVRSLNLSGGVFLEANLRAPWSIAAKITEEDCRPFMAVPHQIIAYHLVTDGQMVVEIEGGVQHVAKAGEIVFLPSNPMHILSSETGLPPTLGDELVLPPSGDGLARIKVSGQGDETNLLCGFIASSAGPNPLLNSIPNLLIIAIEQVATQRWLEASIAIAAQELTSGRVSSDAVTAQVSEILLVEALRAYLETEDRPKGWLAAMADPKIAHALSLIHAADDGTQRISDLADEVGMSRTAFVTAFSNILGVSPGRYSLAHRMTKAKMMLRDSGFTIYEVAFRCGYDAPEAFSRAFKRETGHAPADWKRSQE